jgi:hypothetical protein
VPRLALGAFFLANANMAVHADRFRAVPQALPVGVAAAAGVLIAWVRRVTVR